MREDGWIGVGAGCCWFSMTLAHAFSLFLFVCDAHIFSLPKKTNCTVCKSYHSLEKRKYVKDGAGHLDDHDQVTGSCLARREFPLHYRNLKPQIPHSGFSYLLISEVVRWGNEERILGRGGKEG
ncbi:hypothetical protein BGZ57DRAFT_37760 [Hyaloscypha finlandica]|nr:hypothetical protein BGZ57DRAFT_37760 [Hyaloscypha finlandica]